MRKIIYLCFLSIALLSVSCDREDSFIDNPDGTSKVQEKRPDDDMLHFNSMDEFKSYISEYLDSDTDLLEEAKREAQEGVRVPLLLLYNLNLTQLDSMKVDRKKVAIVNSYDDMLHFLLNRNGEISIEDFVYRINGDFVFKYTMGASGEITSFMRKFTNGEIRMKKGETLEYSSNLDVFMHENNESIEEDISNTILYNAEENEGGNTTGKDSKSTVEKNNKSIYTYYTYFSSGNTRMIAKKYYGSWMFYTSLGASTKTQRKISYYWWHWTWKKGWHKHYFYYWKTVKAYNRLKYKGTYSIYFFGSLLYAGPMNGHRYTYGYSAYKHVAWTVNYWGIYKTTAHGQIHHWSHWFSESPSVVHKYVNF